MQQLAGKVAIVTGVGLGIGAAIAEVFAACGARVIGLENCEETLAATAKSIAAAGGYFHPIRTDVCVGSSVEAAFREIEAQYSKVDVLVNNVGVEFYKDFVSVTESDWDRQLTVNLKSAFLCCSRVAPKMIAARSGCIINTGSVQAFASTGQTAPYAAAKAGVLAFTRDLARDLGPHNIRVNGICPGCIETPMMTRSLARNPDPAAAKEKMASTIPLRRLGTPREVANVVAFLASDAASYVSGVSLLIDGGLLAQLPVT